MMTSNNAESMNVMNVNPIDFPIIRLLKFLRGCFEQWFYERKEAIVVIFTVLAKTPEDNLMRVYENSMRMEVIVLALVP